MHKNQLLSISLAVVAIAVVASVRAQPPGRGPFGRGPGSGSGGGFGGGPGGGFNPAEMLKRMDANGNGMIEPGEAQGPARHMIHRVAERLRMDPNQPIPLSKITEMMDQRRRDEEQRRDAERKRQDELAKKDEPLVPGFGVEVEEGVILVPGFGLPEDSPLLSKLPLEKRYDKRILDQMKDTLRRYDRNRDGILDAKEIKEARWTYGDPRKNDLDGDGRLNKVELAERYAIRYGNSFAKKSSSSSSKPKTSSSSSSTSTSTSEHAKLKKYAQSLMKQYDKNNNGIIDREEWAKMPKPERYNRNKDHIITMDELVYGASNFAKGSSSGSSTRSKYGSKSSSGSPGSKLAYYKTRTTKDRLSKLGVPSSFISDDANADGQLEMSEFSSTWTDAKVAEFRSWDLNGDWVITPEEWLQAEDQKRASRNKK